MLHVSANVQTLVAALQKAINNQGFEDLAKQVAIFKSIPKSLVDMIKQSQLDNNDDEKLWLDDSESTTKPNEKTLPKLVLVITEYENNWGREKMIDGIKTYQKLKETFAGKIAFLKLKRKDGANLPTKEPEVGAIPVKCDLESLRGFPCFIFIKNGNYYWFRNTMFTLSSVESWVDDALNELSYLTGKIAWNSMPTIVKWFWEDKGNLTEHLSKCALRLGSRKKQNILEMGEPYDMWHESWFTAVEEGGMMFHLDSLMDFQKQFRKQINPVTVKPWNYKYIFPNPDWPGWQKLPYLQKKGLDEVHIETAIAPLKEYVVVQDKDSKAIKVFFDGEQEEEKKPAPKPQFDIDKEFGEIGDITWDGPDVDVSDINLDEMSKQAIALQNAELARVGAYNREVDTIVSGLEKGDVKAQHRGPGGAPIKPPGGPRPAAGNQPKPATKPAAKQPPKQGAPGSVQDGIFDYLDEMLQKNVLADDKDADLLDEEF